MKGNNFFKIREATVRLMQDPSLLISGSLLFPVHHVSVYNLVTREKWTEFPTSCESHSKLIFINTADIVVVFYVCFR